MLNEQKTQSIEDYKFEPIKGYPMLNWKGKRPYTSTQYYPAQLKEVYGEAQNGWLNKIFWGDNLQVMSHLLKEYRGQINMVYIDPPFDSDADYKKKIKLKTQKLTNEYNIFEEKQYGDIWNNDEYLQFMYERLILIRELLAETGTIYLHCDHHKVHQIRCIMDEIFGPENFLNEVIWCYQEREISKTHYNAKHDNILFYAKNKTSNYTFNYNDVRESYSAKTLEKFKYTDPEGRKYRLRYKDGRSDPAVESEETYRQYLDESGPLARDWFNLPILNQAANERTAYPTQKPEALLEKFIKASTNEGDLIFDCFMGSGTTQVVASKLNRRFIGADINLAAIKTTIDRLITLESTSGLEVYNVNNYDLFRNPIIAKSIISEALEIQSLNNSSIFDGEKDGYMVKIMPVNRIATKADLNDLIANLDYKTYELRQKEHPNQPVDNILLVCMGHESDLAASLEKEIPFKVKVEVVDILRDRANLEFKRDSEALITIENSELIIQNFYPMNLLQKLSIMKENVTNWKELVESVMIDWNYDGAVFEPLVVDIPTKNEFVSGIYNIPKEAGTIRVKITDLLSESLEVSIDNE